MNKQKGLSDKKCAECGKTFSPWRSFQTFCSKSCGQIKHMANYWKRKLKAEEKCATSPGSESGSPGNCDGSAEPRA